MVAHVILLLGPPLISQDVFGYLGFARMGALHGLDPYTHFPAEAPADAVFPFLGWPFQHSPYGPLFTLASYALAPLGLAGGLWALKALAAVASLGAVALIARRRRRLGRSRAVAAAFVGLNPVLLELAVGGAHNDTLVMLCARRRAARSTPRGGASAPARGLARAPARGAPSLVAASASSSRPGSCCRSWCSRRRAAARALAGRARGAVLALAALAASG